MHQPHPITINRTGFQVRAVLVLGVIIVLLLLIISLSVISLGCLRQLFGFLFSFHSYRITHVSFRKLGISGSATIYLRICFCPWTFSLNIEHDTFGFLYVTFRFSTRILYGGFQALQLVVLVVIGAVD